MHATTHAEPASTARPWWIRVSLALAVLVLALVLLVVFFPWDLLRGPVNRYVSEKTGRHFAITRKLDVKLGRTTRVLFDGIEFANPEWAKDPYLVRAEGGEIQVRLSPLLHRKIELPLVQLRHPELGLQLAADGRRSWALGRDSGDPANIPDIGALVIDEGSMHFVADAHRADVMTTFSLQGEQAMPLAFQSKGTWQGEAFTAKGRTGNVLYLSAPLQNPFPLEIDAVAGATTLRARGAIASLATLEGSDATVDLQGRNLADLYKLVGVVLPATPHYAVHGKVRKNGEVWNVTQLQGKLGNTDIAGDLSYDRQQQVPHLAGHVKSKWLDFDDLAPLVGLPVQPRKPPDAVQVAQQRAAKKDKAARDPNLKVLPQARLDLAKLKAMNSEVTYSAARVTNVPNLPLERVAVKVRLEGGVLNLDDVNLGVAGGTLAGRMKIDSHSDPAAVELHLDARSLELNRLFKNEALTKSSFGKIHGDFDIAGRGNSVAQMLATANGNAALLMGQGQISNLLLEIAGLDGREILKFLIGGDRNVGVRCAATAFDVSHGVMSSRALVLDTTDTIVYGDGDVNLANEKLDLYFRPYPKDMSILSLRSPLRLDGTLGAPHAGPDKAALGGRAGLALALGAINPLLALAATVETGPGKDADCRAILKEAASPQAAARVEKLARHQQEATRTLGGPVRPKRMQKPSQ